MDIKINKGKVKSAIKQVVVNEMTVQNMVDASRLASATDGPAFMAALLSQICVFDGKQLTYEEVTELPAAVFLELSGSVGNVRYAAVRRAAFYLIREGHFSYDGVMRMGLAELSGWIEELNGFYEERNRKK